MNEQTVEEIYTKTKYHLVKDTYMKKLVTGKKIVFAEGSGSVYKRIMDMKKLNVG